MLLPFQLKYNNKKIIIKNNTSSATFLICGNNFQNTFRRLLNSIKSAPKGTATIDQHSQNGTTISPSSPEILFGVEQNNYLCMLLPFQLKYNNKKIIIKNNTSSATFLICGNNFQNTFRRLLNSIKSAPKGTATIDQHSQNGTTISPSSPEILFGVEQNNYPPLPPFKLTQEVLLYAVNKL